MDSIYKILESLDKVNENKESGVKITNIQWKDSEAKLPSSLKLNITAPSGSSNEQIYDRIHDVLKDEYGEADDFEFQFEESLEEGQYDGKSREELMKMKAEAEASVQKLAKTTNWQNDFYDETQMMMAQQHLDSIDNALKKLGENVEEAEITPIDHSEEDDYDGASVEDIASAITRRMMNAKNFGALVREIDILDLNDAIEEVARFHEGGDLGTSDVSNMVRDVLKQLGKQDMKLEDVEVKEAVSLDQARKYFFDKHDFADENIQGEYEKMASKMSSKDAMILKKELEELYPEALEEEELSEMMGYYTIYKDGKVVATGVRATSKEDAINQAYMKMGSASKYTGAGRGSFEAVREEVEVEEGNDFTKARLDAIKAGKDSFEVDGKTYKVTGDTSDEEAMTEGDEDSMPASPDEGAMAGDQAEFIKYAIDEIKDHIEAGGDFPEWFQNKMSDVYGKMKDLHGYMEGDKRNDAEQEAEEDEEVEETTTAGGIATTATGKGIFKNASVYESFNNKVESMITEGMNVSINRSNEPGAEPSVTVSATGADALALAQLLQLAKVEKPMAPCESCGRVHEGSCMNEENEANSAKNTTTYDMYYLLDAISGGLNGKKQQINPNNPGDNPMAMDPNKTVNVAESEESHLEKLYKKYNLGE